MDGGEEDDKEAEERSPVGVIDDVEEIVKCLCEWRCYAVILSWRWRSSLRRGGVCI